MRACPTVFAAHRGNSTSNLSFSLHLPLQVPLQQQLQTMAQLDSTPLRPQQLPPLPHPTQAVHQHALALRLAPQEAATVVPRPAKSTVLSQKGSALKQHRNIGGK